MFSNCYKYNPADHEVVAMARKLQVRTRVVAACFGFRSGPTSLLTSFSQRKGRVVLKKC